MNPVRSHRTIAQTTPTIAHEVRCVVGGRWLSLTIETADPERAAAIALRTLGPLTIVELEPVIASEPADLPLAV